MCGKQVRGFAVFALRCTQRTPLRCITPSLWSFLLFACFPPCAQILDVSKYKQSTV